MTPLSLERPSGTVTFLLTDIEGSTRNWETDPSAMREGLARHDALLNEVIAAHEGHVLTERGEGDSFFAVFERASDAVSAASALQLALYREAWPDGAPVRVRMAIHTGEAGGDYRGQDVNRCARLRAIAYGGQVILSAATEALVRRQLPPGASVQDMGQHRLRDLAQPERVYQLNHADLPSEFPRLRSLDAFKHNLPVQLTSFVGREKQIEEVKRRLRDHRLVTVTGAGGSGKTRLALQVAADVVEDYEDGVWLVDLSPLAEPALVDRAVAISLGINEQAGQPLAQTLVDHLRDKNLLMVLDNCEHVVEAASRLTESVLRQTPDLRMLATSREPLNILGEAAWAIPSLSTPDLDHLPSLDAIGEYEAVRLFLDRAFVARPKFAPTQADTTAIAHIGHRLDGVPLAIELAAAQMKLMRPDDILSRLKDRFRLLTRGSRTALPRQKTLRAAVDWSHDLLSDAERALFRRLSVFAGGFDLEATEQVSRSEALPEEDILEVLGALVDKSLVVADVDGGGSIRYRLHETLRQYGHEKLIEAQEEEEARDQHLKYFLDLAERAIAHAGRVDPNPPWLDRQEREHENFRAALGWARERHPEEYLQLAGALSWFWFLRSSHLSEGREWLGDALTRQPRRTASAARALAGASLLASWQGDPASAQSLAKESLGVWTELGDQMGMALALEAMGWSHFVGGDDPSALRYMSEGLEIFRSTGNPRLINRGALNVTQVLVSHADVDEAESMSRDVLARGQDLGEPRDIHLAHHFLADCALARGDVVEAEQRYGKSLRAALNYGNIAEAGVELQGVAMGLAGQGRLEKAFTLNAAAEAKMRELGLDMSGIPFWAGYLRRYFGPARESFGEERVASAEEEGRLMSFDAAIDYGLDRARD
jgi:predicted ATPase/class 3 adenylate cyclase